MNKETLHDHLLRPEQALRAVKLAEQIDSPEAAAKAARNIIHLHDALQQCAVSYIQLAKKRREEGARHKKLLQSVQDELMASGWHPEPLLQKLEAELARR